MKKTFAIVGSSTFALSLFLLGCGSPDIEAAEVAIDSPAIEALDSNAKVQTLDGPVEIRLERIGNPKWKPVDFHHFSATWWQVYSIAQSIMPPPNHGWHPDLGISPGAAHEGPYEDEIAGGVEAKGYVDTSDFTLAEFANGVIHMFMVVPRNDGSPRMSSPDFDNGAVIPNDIFPIHIDGRYSREDWVDPKSYAFDVHALDVINPPYLVDGHSHFPIFGNDASKFYPYPRGNKSYLAEWVMTDATGEGWHIKMPFRVH